MILFLIVMLAMPQVANPSPHGLDKCVLSEGVGASFGKLGVTKRSDVGAVPHGIVLDFRDGVLSEIIVKSGECRTSKGVKLGDSQDQVRRLYGKGREKTVYLTKGKSDNLGPLGDFVLEYSGVAFVIYEGKVAALFIRSPGINNAKSAKP